MNKIKNFLNISCIPLYVVGIGLCMSGGHFIAKAMITDKSIYALFGICSIVVGTLVNNNARKRLSNNG